jgi:type III secretory pathway component EscS
MDPVLVGLGREALVLALWVSLPPLGAALLVGLLVGALQAATQIQDPGVAVVPRLCAVIGALAVASPWIAAEVVRFATACLEQASGILP